MDVEETTIEKKISSNSLLTLLGFADKNVHRKNSETFLTVPLDIVAILRNLILAQTNPFYVVRYVTNDEKFPMATKEHIFIC